MTRKGIWSVKPRAWVTSTAPEWEELLRKTPWSEPRWTWINNTLTILVASSSSSRCSTRRKWVDYSLKETSWTMSKTAARTAASRSPSSNSLNNKPTTCNLSRWVTCLTFSNNQTGNSLCSIRWVVNNRLSSRCKEVGSNSSRWWTYARLSSNSRLWTHRLKHSRLWIKATSPTRTCSNPSKRCQSSAKPTIWWAVRWSKHNLTYMISSNDSNSRKTCSLIIWTDLKVVRESGWILEEASSQRLRSRSNSTGAMRVAQIPIWSFRRTIASTRTSIRWLVYRSPSNTETEVTWWEGCHRLYAKL